ncbi:MBL fold metallo-hydrolase [Nonomuraea sp. MCN248]|uniref:MBL fold metallo-hydrolase n=1 Tax=Nonomuraea corallina TaxID=2989783 RepID=A0ABT4S5W0_9ACTN|nr:MBL fold metallo-hydrolase [Nonomuraea corallina]MDA0632587.1 MBL fold metallo-hydrolase [Nonomuraea corallina]
MDLIELRPHLHLLRFPVGNAYLWHERDAPSLIDTGVAGSGKDVEGAVRSLGFTLADLRHVIVTHGHDDHHGALAEITTEATVMVHRADAPVVRGEAAQQTPDRADMPEWEREIYDSLPPMPPVPSARVDRELEGGEVIDFGGGAEVIPIPGHTDGSVALYLPAHRLLFAGDTVATLNGQVILGVFNADRAGAVASFRRLADLDLGLVCVGHGDPVTGEATTRLREVAAQL